MLSNKKNIAEIGQRIYSEFFRWIFDTPPNIIRIRFLS